MPYKSKKIVKGSNAYITIMQLRTLTDGRYGMLGTNFEWILALYYKSDKEGIEHWPP